MSQQSWTLTVGAADLSLYVTEMLLQEIASSSLGSGIFTVNGSHDVIVENASVRLTDGNGKIAWEGTVTRINDYGNSTGVTVAPLSSQAAVGTNYGNTFGSDVAVLAAAVLSQTSLPWGGPAHLGVEAGALTFSRVDDALTVLATLAHSTWRVENGAAVFVSGANGLTTIPESVTTTSNAASAVHIKAGADAVTRIPLETIVTTVGSPSGPVVYASYPEIADIGTLGVLAGSLGEAYGAGSVAGKASFQGVTLRAGDWAIDSNNVVAIAWQTQYEIVGGLLQCTATFGYPALPQDPQYSASFSDIMHRFPVARLQNDYVVRGTDISAVGGGVIVASAIVVFGNTLYPLSQQTLSLPNGVSYIIATSSAFAVSSQPSSVPGSAMTLWQVTVTNGVITQTLDLRPHGGAGSNNVQPNALYPVHFSGDTSGDRSISIFNGSTKTMEHAVMSQPTQARILNDNTLKVDGTTGPVSGNLPHPNMATSYTGNFNSSGVLQSSATMNDKVPNSSAYFQDFTWEWSYTYHTGTPNYYLFTIWYDNGTASTNATIYLPNYSTTPGDRDIDIGYTTSSSSPGPPPNVTNFKVNSGQSLYLMAYYDPSLGVQVQASTSPFLPSDLRTASQDGGYITAFATVGTGAVFTPSGTSGGTGSASGNGGHIPSKF